jgi:hypothetical protein
MWREGTVSHASNNLFAVSGTDAIIIVLINPLRPYPLPLSQAIRSNDEEIVSLLRSNGTK